VHVDNWVILTFSMILKLTYKKIHGSAISSSDFDEL